MEQDQKDSEEVLTLGDHRQLWFGGKDGKKDIQFRPWKGRQEAELSKILYKARDQLKGGRVCKRVSYILQYMCLEIGGHKFWEPTDNGDYRELMSQAERELVIRNMWETDVLIAYFLLRMDCLDSIVSISMPSQFDPTGKREVTWTGDISQLPFMGSSNIEDCKWEYQLIESAKVRGKQVRNVEMGPLRWATVEDLKVLNPGPATMKSIAGSIHRVPEAFDTYDVTYAVSDLYDFSKKDLSAIPKEMDQNHHGLDLAIEVFDPEEDKSFETSVPWTHPDFFAVSSQ